MITFKIEWNEDGSATVLGRLTARDGTGAATGRKGEGRFLKRADILTINRKVFDLDGGSPDSPTNGVSGEDIDIAAVILDTPVTSTEIWTKDSYGYNLIDDLGPTLFPEGGHHYSVEYRVQTTGGFVFHAAYTGPARAVRGS